MPEFLIGENQRDRRLFLQCGASTLAVGAYLPLVGCRGTEPPDAALAYSEGPEARKHRNEHGM